MSRISRIPSYFLMAGLVLTSISGCGDVPSQSKESAQTSEQATQANQNQTQSSPVTEDSNAAVSQEVRNKLQELKEQFSKNAESKSFYSKTLGQIKSFDEAYKNWKKNLPDSLKNVSQIQKQIRQIDDSTAQSITILDQLASKNFIQAQKLLKIKADGQDNNDTRNSTIKFLDKQLSTLEGDLDKLENLITLESIKTAVATKTPAISNANGLIHLLLGVSLIFNIIIILLIFLLNYHNLLITLDKGNHHQFSNLIKKLSDLKISFARIQREITKNSRNINQLKKYKENSNLDNDEAINLLNDVSSSLEKIQLESLKKIQSEMSRIFVETIYQLTSQNENKTSQNEDTESGYITKQDMQEVIETPFKQLSSTIGRLENSFVTNQNNQGNIINNNINTLNNNINNYFRNHLIPQLSALQNFQTAVINSNQNVTHQLSLLPQQLYDAVKPNLYQPPQEQNQIGLQLGNVGNENIHQLEQQKTEYEAKIRSLEQQKSELESSLNGSRKQIENLQQQIDQNRISFQQLEESQKNINLNQEKIIQLERQKTEYEAKIKSLEQQKSGLESRKNFLENQLANLNKQLTDATNKNHEYDEELRKINHQKSNLETKVSKLQRELNNLSPATNQSRTPLSPQLVKLVDSFNQNPQSLSNLVSVVSEVSETVGSSSKRYSSGSKDVILETPETNIGDFWIVEQTGCAYLFPKNNAISIGQAQTAKALFDGYRESDTTQFELLRPAKVSRSGNVTQWKLDEKGELKHC